MLWDFEKEKLNNTVEQKIVQMSPQQKIDFVNFIIGILNANQASDIDLFKEEPYNQFVSIMSRLEVEEKEKSLNKLVTRINKLDYEYQEKLLNYIKNTIDDRLPTLERDQKVSKCHHEFTPWKHTEYTDYMDGYIDRNPARVGVKKEYWSRICPICLFCERVDEEPKEVKRKKKKEKIKKLKKEIKRLEESDE